MTRKTPSVPQACAQAAGSRPSQASPLYLDITSRSAATFSSSITQAEMQVAARMMGDPRCDSEPSAGRSSSRALSRSLSRPLTHSLHSAPLSPHPTHPPTHSLTPLTHFASLHSLAQSLTPPLAHATSLHSTPLRSTPTPTHFTPLTDFTHSPTSLHSLARSLTPLHSTHRTAVPLLTPPHPTPLTEQQRRVDHPG